MNEVEESFFWAQADLTKAIDGLTDTLHLMDGPAETRAQLKDIRDILAGHLSALSDMQEAIINGQPVSR